MMTVNWGPYKFPTVNPVIAIERPAIVNGREERLGYTEIWRLTGKLISQSNNPNELTNLIALMEAAFKVDGQDLTLTMPDGSISAHALKSSACLGGTRVTKLASYPEGDGIEYVTLRSYELEVQGEVYDLATANSLWSFEETLAIVGNCGPVVGWMTPKYGNSIQQVWKSQSTCTAIQSGSAKGMFGYPQLPNPLWPGFEKESAREVTPGQPRKFGTAFNLYPIDWKYYFESGVPLSATPTIL
jgi:hypothetical protein